MQYKHQQSLLKLFYSDTPLMCAGIIVFSLIMSLFFIIALINLGPKEHREPGTDFQTFYEPVAISILSGNGMQVQSGQGLRYPIGYPVFLAGTFYLADTLAVDRLDFIIIINALLLALSSAVVFLTGKAMGNKQIGILTAVLFSSYPFILWFLKQPNTEIPFFLLFYLGVLFFIFTLQKKSYLFAGISGFLIGLSSYVRAVTFYLPFFLVVLLFFFIQSKTFKKNLLVPLFFLGGVFIVVLPWILYVSFTTGKLIPLSSGGSSTIVGGFDNLISVGGDGKTLNLSPDIIEFIKNMQRADIKSISDGFAYLFKGLVNQPVTVVKLMSIKLVRSWYATTELWWENFILAIQLCYLIPAIAGMIIAWKKFKKKKAHIMTLFTIIFFFWSTALATAAILRYLIPVMAFIFFFTAVAIYSFFLRFRNQKQPTNNYDNPRNLNERK